MKKLISLALITLIAVNSFASGKDKQIKCAVQGFEISVAQATKDHMYADYKGRRYFFCCSGCPEQFKANPAKFAPKAESIPTPKPAKKTSAKRR